MWHKSRVGRARRCMALATGIRQPAKGAQFASEQYRSDRSKAMNKDQVKGPVKEAAGKVQEKTGEVVGSKTQQAKGMAKEVEGKAQKAAGDVKDAVKKS